MIKKWFAFRFHPTKETWLAIGIGVIAILYSYAMTAIGSIGSILIRDYLMIVGIGLYFTLWRIKPTMLYEYGLTFDKWKRNFIINIILAVLLLFVMIPPLILQGKAFAPINSHTLSSSLFIMIAGVFEMMLFYTYQRVVFEKAFGKIPAIILCSAFYSLHHAGFQPEFIKLFFVGISFVLVVSLTNNIWSIFPFYWAVGALLDVLVQSDVVSPIQYPFIRSIIMLVLIGVAIYLYISKRNKDENHNRTHPRL